MAFKSTKIKWILGRMSGADGKRLVKFKRMYINASQPPASIQNNATQVQRVR